MSIQNTYIREYQHVNDFLYVQDSRQSILRERKLNKNHSHLIQFTSPVLPWSKVYVKFHGRTSINLRFYGD